MFGWLSLVFCVLAHAQNASVVNLDIPRLPISKANARYPECRAEIIFVLDVSASVNSTNQQKQMRFVVQFMIAVEANILDARFAVISFGIDNEDNAGNKFPAGTNLKSFNATQFGAGFSYLPSPYGNDAFPASTETTLSLSNLKYNCTECGKVNTSWSQLEYMYTLRYEGWLTPTWDGLQFAKEEYDLRGDKNVPGRFIVLITDGVPNIGGGVATSCVNWNDPGCPAAVSRATQAVNNAKNGTLLLTVGVNLKAETATLMTTWASEPKEILAIPNTDYDKLNDLINGILDVMCPVGKGTDCLAKNATSVDITGFGFLNTEDLACRFFRDEDPPGAYLNTKAQWVNSTLFHCPIPTEKWFPGEWNMNYTQDGRGFYKGARFKIGIPCRPEERCDPASKNCTSPSSGASCDPASKNCTSPSSGASFAPSVVLCVFVVFCTIFF